MSLIKEEQINASMIHHVAEKMMIAARTAPKARGMDNLEIAVADSEIIRLLSDKMRELGSRLNAPGMIRDAENLENAKAVLLIGTRIKSTGLQERCAFCGYKNCIEKDKYPDQPCVYNTHDLGLAVGSAVSIAADNRTDTRVMYSIGKAAVELKLLGNEVKIAMGIPLSATAKNPFFDRK